MRPAKQNIRVYTGSDYEESYRFTVKGLPMDLTGYQAHAQIRYPDGNLVATGDITIEPLEGRVIVRIPRASTVGVPDGTAEWDLILVDPSGKAKPYIRGTVTLEQLATEVI